MTSMVKAKHRQYEDIDNGMPRTGLGRRQKPLGLPGPKYLENWPAQQPEGSGQNRDDHNKKSRSETGF